MKNTAGIRSCQNDVPLSSEPDKPETRRTENDPVVELADVVRTAYIHERRLREEMRSDKPSNYLPATQWDGGRVIRFDKVIFVQPIWPRIAKLLLKHKIDPLVYVRAQFASRSLSASDLQPNQLLGEKALERYRKACPEERRRQQVIDAFNHQQTVLAVTLTDYIDRPNLTVDQIRKTVLCDTQLPFSPLFRYCLAVSEGYTALAEEFFTHAAIEFCLNATNYLEVWRHWIPPDFPDKARACLRMPRLNETADNDKGM